MRLTFREFWPLILLIIVPILWRVQRRTLNDLSQKQLYFLGTVRSAVIAMLVLALMRPVIHTSVVRFSVAYLVDVSRSVAPAAMDSAMQWIQQTNHLKSPEFEVERHIIPFGANSIVLGNIEGVKNFKIDLID